MKSHLVRTKAKLKPSGPGANHMLQIIKCHMAHVASYIPKIEYSAKLAISRLVNNSLNIQPNRYNYGTIIVVKNKVPQNSLNRNGSRLLSINKSQPYPWITMFLSHVEKRSITCITQLLSLCSHLNLGNSIAHNPNQHESKLNNS